MTPHLTITSLLLAFAAGITGQVQAAEQQPSSLSRETCAIQRHDIDAISAHIREALASRSGKPMGPAGYETLALELVSHFEGLQTNLPSPGTQRAQASLLLSDMRDAVSLMRNAERPDARQVAVQRIEQDLRLYDSVLKTLGCSETGPTPP